MVRATVICDASWCPNTRSGGWACWVNINYDDGGHSRVTRSGIFRHRARSSNHAEQMACLNGIFLAYSYGARDILVQTDCLNLVTSQGSTTHPKSMREYEDAHNKYWSDANITWRHVKGHNLGTVQDRRTWVNDWCDKNAKRMMRKQRSNTERKTNGKNRVSGSAG